ncbi:uncharacterized protein OCT59_012866 [Rhizophagus irregularis]|uniref:uncharacterized protein n=1 Tax=Rhizophagus irregularis TaxID=588596 RepID=UPI003325DE24|nr:hypothetical protein OCT59_012866 [Rhizophagus irregularis]
MYTRNVVHTTTLKNLDAGVLHTSLCKVLPITPAQENGQETAPHLTTRNCATFNIKPIKVLLENKAIGYYDSQHLICYDVIGSGGSASVYAANWKNTSTVYAIKTFVSNEEVYLTHLADGHQNIIRLHGVTNLDKKEYSLVLECADGGTLKDHLRKNTIYWKNQLRFAKEIASAVLWLHDDKGIVHGDLHSNNILIHKDTIKLADFGLSFEKGKDRNNTGVYGVIPIGVLFWELSSYKSPFNGLDDDHITFKILNGVREEPVPNTNVKFIELYQKCWEQEPDERPNISQVNSVLNSIDSKSNNVSIVSGSEENGNDHSCQINLSKISQLY